MLPLGIMQGRLTPSRGRGIQFFPFDNWEREFELCAELGLDEIEWIFDYDRYEQNPLWTEEGCGRIREVMQHTGVKVHSVCFDYFMRHPFFKYQEDQQAVKSENQTIFETVVDHMQLLGASLIEIPLVDTSAVTNDYEKELAVGFIGDLAVHASQNGIRVGLETDLPPVAFSAFIEAVSMPNVYANYDTGNSSGNGYDHREEILTLSSRIVNVHIKDRQLHGATVSLGSGNADFDKVFSALEEIGYCKSLILQAARSADGAESNNIKKQAGFVREYCRRYHLGEL